MAETSQTLPGDVREQLESLITSTDAAQANLRTTLEELDQVLENGTRPGTAWQATADSVNAVLVRIHELSDSDEQGEAEVAPRPAGKPFDIDDDTRAANAIHGGATEVRGMLEDLESGKLEPTMAALETTAGSSVDHAAGEARKLVDQLTSRALLLLGGLLVVLVLARVIGAKPSSASG